MKNHKGGEILDCIEDSVLPLGFHVGYVGAMAGSAVSIAVGQMHRTEGAADQGSPPHMHGHCGTTV